MSHAILLIDDNQEFRETLREMLELEGYAVREAADGEQGIRSFRNEPADLVITDLIMPNKEGIETIFELREQYPELKIVAVSGGGNFGSGAYLDLAACIVDATYTKPIDRKGLVDGIRRLLE